MICEQNIKRKDFSIDLIKLNDRLRLISIVLEPVAEGELRLPNAFIYSLEEDPAKDEPNPVWCAIDCIEEVIDDLKVIGNALYPTLIIGILWVLYFARDFERDL